MVLIMQNTEEADLKGDKINSVRTREVCVDRNKLYPGKNGGLKPSGLGGMSIVLIRQVGRQ